MGRGTAMLERTTTAALTARVAVLMPAYNPGPFINRSVESLVRNTHECDIYIVDDGSKIPVTQILDDFPRTTVIRLEQNRGVVHARNVGLRAILRQPYEFVACLDADDISYPDRIAKEVEFLDSHPEIAVVGAWARFVEEASGRMVFIGRTPESPELVRKTMNYNTAVINSSSMIRASALNAVGLYSEKYPVAEDYELFRRIAQQFPVANLPIILVDMRLSPGGLSLTRRRRQLFDRFRIQLKYFRPLEIGAWVGLVKTLALFLVPRALVTKFKSFRYSV